MNSDQKFQLIVSSDLDYEKMVVYLMDFNNRVLTLNCDHGIDLAEIEILDRLTDKVIWKFNYHQFISALSLAYQKLKEVNET